MPPLPANTTLISTQVPLPLGPIAAYLVPNCSANVSTAPSGIYGGQVQQPGLSTGVTLDQNQTLAHIANAAAWGGVGAFGIVSGLGLTAGTGLTLNIGAGSAMSSGNIPVPSALTATMNMSARSFVWLSQYGNIVVVNASLTPPNVNDVFLGSALCSSTAITSIDMAGAFSLAGGLAIRSTADRGMPADSPTANTYFDSQTNSGVWRWNGSLYVPLGKQISQLTVTGSQTGAITDGYVNYYVTVSGGNQNWLLPNPTALPLGWAFTFSNVGSSNNLVLKDYTGTTTLATIDPGYGVGNSVVIASGVQVFPGSTPWTTSAFGPAPPFGPI
jgi:hypothetical protein